MLAHYLPGTSVHDVRALDAARYAITLASEERWFLELYRSASEVTAACAAINLVRAEFDLPVPQVLVAESDSTTLDTPFVLLSGVGGEPLSGVVGQIPDQMLYELGQQLGETIYRVHRLTTAHYGALTGAPVVALDERSFVLERLEHDLHHCRNARSLAEEAADHLRRWFTNQFQALSRQPALLHGNLALRNILVRRGQHGWRVSGILGWECALGWSPAWEHALFLELNSDPRLFSFRVGYGNSYDERTSRPYEQVREPALAPYRALLALRRLCAAPPGAVQRHRNLLLSMLQILEGE